MHLVTEILIEHVDCLYLRRPLESKVSYSDASCNWNFNRTCRLSVLTTATWE